jgi:hypothetical protein
MIYYPQCIITNKELYLLSNNKKKIIMIHQKNINNIFEKKKSYQFPSKVINHQQKLNVPKASSDISQTNL